MQEFSRLQQRSEENRGTPRNESARVAGRFVEQHSPSSVSERALLSRHPPIVPQRLFDAVQEALAGHAKDRCADSPSVEPRVPSAPTHPLCEVQQGTHRGIAKKAFRYYWCYSKGCRSVFVPAQELESYFVRWIGQYEPTVEYRALLPSIAKEA
jgi:hypothetical protein